VFILYIFAATCFGTSWPSSSGIQNYFRKLLQPQRRLTEERRKGNREWKKGKRRMDGFFPPFFSLFSFLPKREREKLEEKNKLWVK
jgi:hypothetical protein